MQLYPSAVLAPYISHYLIIENNLSKESVHRFFPDGHPGMIFNYGDIFSQEFNDRGTLHRLPQSMVYGQVNRHFNLVSGKKIGLLIVVFKPFGLSVFTKITSRELTNQTTSTQDIFGNDAEFLTEQVVLGKCHSERIQYIENFLIKFLDFNLMHLSLVKACINKLDFTKGQTSVALLTKELSVSERTLERAFDSLVGISPKQYGRVIRLQQYLKLRQHKPDQHLTTLGYEAGYYDQAHFIREFYDLAGLTPKQYDKNTNRLAVNLMQLE